MSGDPQNEYFSDGLTETLLLEKATAALEQTKLKVAAMLKRPERQL